jgi:hypothetical protein
MARTSSKPSSRTGASARRAVERTIERPVERPVERPIARKAAPQPPARLQLLVSLDNAPVPIWRRLRVRNDVSFGRLHDLLQSAMGWEDAHMHEFVVAERRIGTGQSDALFVDETAPEDERKTELGAALAGVTALRYWYDFGDDWWHTIKIEAVLPLDLDAPEAELIDGAGACPPEDCGGPFGYTQLLSMLGDPRHRDRSELIEMYGAIDPNAFDLEGSRKRFAPRLKRR